MASSLVFNPGVDIFSKASNSERPLNPFVFKPSAQQATNIASVVNQQVAFKPRGKYHETSLDHFRFQFTNSINSQRYSFKKSAQRQQGGQNTESTDFFITRKATDLDRDKWLETSERGVIVSIFQSQPSKRPPQKTDGEELKTEVAFSIPSGPSCR